MRCARKIRKRCKRKRPPPAAVVPPAPLVLEKIITAECLEFHSNLIQDSERLMNSIREMGESSPLHSREALTHSLHRYELFLALLEKTWTESGEDAAASIVPPVDVAHAWRAHLIREQVYHEDCLAMFSRRHLPTAVLFSDCYASEEHGKRSAMLSASRKAWEAFVEEEEIPNMPYDATAIDTSAAVATQLPSVTVQLTVEHLEEDLKWWTDFQEGWGEVYWSDKSAFLQSRLRTYKQFLIDSSKEMDKADASGVPQKSDAGPPVDVDLLWHCHMMRPAVYEQDLKACIGRVFYHRPAADKQ